MLLEEFKSCVPDKLALILQTTTTRENIRTQKHQKKYGLVGLRTRKSIPKRLPMSRGGLETLQYFVANCHLFSQKN